MVSELDKFIEELKTDTAWVCKELPKHGERGEMTLKMLKVVADYLSKENDEEKECP